MLAKLARIASLILLLIALPAMSDDNPLFQDIPLLNYQGITAQNFEPAIDAALQSFDTRLATIIIDPPSWTNTVAPLLRTTNAVIRIWNVINHLNAVNSTPAIHEAYLKLLPKVTGFHAKILYNNELYNAYKTIANSAEFNSLNPEQQNHIKQMLNSFKISGGDLDAAGQARVLEINSKLIQLGHEFTKNLNEASQAWQYFIPTEKESMLAGVPKNIKDAAAEKAKSLGKNGWVLTLEYSNMDAIESYGNNRELREIMYKAYNTLASDQAENPSDHKWDNATIVKQMLELRHELAIKLGYKSYVEYVLATKGPQTPDEVLNFLNFLGGQVKTAAQTEVNILTEFARNRDRIEKLEAWDLPYYAQKYKDIKYVVNNNEIRKYFPKDTVVQGLFTLTNLIYNINFQEVQGASVWNDNVQVYSVTDQNKQLRGYFYLDLFARKNKINENWLGVYTSRLKMNDSSVQLPVAFVNASFSSATDGLLEYNEVLTLFNEFGQMLDHVLSLSNYPNISGIGSISLESDKMTGQFMQEWFWVYDVLLDVSRNISTGQDLPQAMFQQMLAAKNYNAALTILKQVEVSLFDFNLHANLPANNNKNAVEILQSIQQQTALHPHYEYERMPNHFSYDFATGYAANYYVYIWSNVLAADAFAAFKEKSLFDPQMGRKFLQTFLEKTGDESTLELFVKFRGREPSTDPYLRQSGIIK